MPESTDQHVGREETLDPRSQNEAAAASGVDQPPAPDDIEGLREELAAAQQEAASNNDKYLRARADMENYKKRVERTYADLAKASKTDLLTKLLSVKDNLERALQYGEQGGNGGEGILEGIRLTEYQLDQLLAGEGVKQIEAQGKLFDPHLEEAIQSVDDPSVPDHTVVQVVRNGYTYGDEVLRPAQVIVSVNDTGQS
jgi:molecular chaperone GrpE